MEWVVVPPLTRQERRRAHRANARAKWRLEHLSGPSGYRLWDGNNRWSKKVHLCRRVNADRVDTWCGLFTLFEVRRSEYYGCAAEEPEIPTSATLCQLCRWAVRASGTHPLRRRKDRQAARRHEKQLAWCRQANAVAYRASWSAPADIPEAQR